MDIKEGDAVAEINDLENVGIVRSVKEINGINSYGVEFNHGGIRIHYEQELMKL